MGPTTERGLTEGLEGTLEDSISQDSGVDSSNHPHEFSPQPQGDGQPCSREDLSGGDGGRADRELSDIEQSDVDDFGDFQGVCDGESGENVSRGKEEEVCLDSKAENTSQDWDSSQMNQISSQPLAKESDKLKCKESESARHRADTSPPPLDCVIEDEMCSSSPVPDAAAPADNDDADFGDFATHEAAFHLSNGTNTEDKCSSDTTLDNHQLSHINTMASSTTPNTVHPITSTTERLQADGDSQDEDSTCKTSRVTRSVEGEGNEEEEDEEGGKQGGDSSTSLQVKGCVRSEEENEVVIPDTTEETQTPPPSLTPRDERGAGDGMATSQGNTREKSEESKVNEELRTGDKLGTDIDNGNDDKSLSGNESVVPESDEGVKESEAKVKGREGEGGEVELKSDATERLSDVCGNENESDFGDFNQAENDDDDDDDLDFADLRKQVEEGMYGEFGDFTSGFGEGNDDDGGDDFGDFTASADTTKTKSECNDFGDFVVPGKENVGEDDLSQNFNEDFGDFNEEFGDFNEEFGDFNDPENSEALKGFTTPAAQEAAHFQTHQDSVCKASPVLQKVREHYLILMLLFFTLLPHNYIHTVLITIIFHTFGKKASMNNYLHPISSYLKFLNSWKVSLQNGYQEQQRHRRTAARCRCCIRP